jgi:hypothetical protein
MADGLYAAARYPGGLEQFYVPTGPLQAISGGQSADPCPDNGGTRHS